MTNKFDLQLLFHSDGVEKSNFMARVFGLFSEEPVRFWSEMSSSPYEYLGRPTICRKGENAKPWTLDFAFRRKSDSLNFVAEQKCELAFENGRRMTLDSNSQIERHRDKPAFVEFLNAASLPDSFNCSVTTRTNRKTTIQFSGAILVWGRTTPEGRDSAISHYGLADVLSMEAIVNDLLREENRPYREYIEKRMRWCDDLFSALLGK